MRYADAIIDGYNAIVGAIVAVLSYILGEHWILFVAFLLSLEYSSLKQFRQSLWLTDIFLST